MRLTKCQFFEKLNIFLLFSFSFKRKVGCAKNEKYINWWPATIYGQYEESSWINIFPYRVSIAKIFVDWWKTFVHFIAFNGISFCYLMQSNSWLLSIKKGLWIYYSFFNLWIFVQNRLNEWTFFSEKNEFLIIILFEISLKPNSIIINEPLNLECASIKQRAQDELKINSVLSIFMINFSEIDFRGCACFDDERMCILCIH